MDGEFDFTLAEELYETGFLRVIVDNETEPKCYCVWCINPSIIHGEKDRDATVIAIYVKPEHRRHLLMGQMLTFLKEQARLADCRSITFHVPAKAPSHKVFKHLCGQPVEFTYKLNLEE